MATSAAVIAWTYLAGRQWNFGLLWGVLAACLLVLAARTLRGRRGRSRRQPTTHRKGAAVAIGLVLAGAVLILVDGALTLAWRGWSIPAARTLTFGVWAVMFGAWLWYAVRARRDTAQRDGPRGA
jgi:hypothetical protein